MLDRVDVSVICITYNHKEYIRDCLEGIINQKTQYSFEILLHDDASTDGTTDIVREYERKYPEIVRAFYQVENQYSQGVEIVGEYLIPKVRGRFVANCDGDDYWIDKYKLQKQVDFLLEHPGIVGCVTNAKVIDYKHNREYLYCSFKKNKYVGVKDIVYGKEPIIKPSAWLIRADDFIGEKEIIDELGGYGDIFVQLWMLSKSNIYYMKDVSIVYRQYVNGSWSACHDGHTVSVDDVIDKYNKLTGYKHDKYIRGIRNITEYRKINNERDYGLLNTIGIRRLIKSKCLDIAIGLFLYNYIPCVYLLVRKEWRKINGIIDEK